MKDYELTLKGRTYIERTMFELNEDADRYEADPENYIPHKIVAMHSVISNPMMRSYHIILDGLFRGLSVKELYSDTPERYKKFMQQALTKAEREGYIVSYELDTSVFEKEFEDLF